MIQLYIRPVMVKVVCTILSSPETSLQWAAPHVTLTPDFSDLSLGLRFQSILLLEIVLGLRMGSNERVRVSTNHLGPAREQVEKVT